MPYFHQRVVPAMEMDTPSSQPEQSITHQEDRQPIPIPNHIRIKNRRKRYLDLHPDYFSSSLELADPLMYDRLVRRFQTPAEREAEGREKGYSGVLEADLRRSEAKLQAIANPDPNATFNYIRGPDGEIIPEEKEDVPADKDEGFARWKYEMELRFMRGDDHDFDYVHVDESEEYDDIAEEDRARQEEYFGEEEPTFVLEDGKAPEGETGILDY
ncbi:hypothetical protein BLS_006820 [Venturia inaequalis]|uniref:CCD97-like C-terminal domain-containing protein n=2 Tax=Venturia inaequalis TaxID=5025 RepID=A0A8H3UBS5_VENIN|nr:hypothetical protein BLS_006820 [Venturia inaequalis]RDI86891.1 hypothetical protein Vi05172_g3108 [Venturia inaequalis]